MLSRSAQRKKAYQFICEKSRELESKSGYRLDRVADETDIISLAELDKLRTGMADPSDELKSVLTKLLRPVASEKEIDRYLIKPFETITDGR